MRFGRYPIPSQTHIMSLRIILTVKEEEYWICGCGYKPTDFDSLGGRLSLINMATWIKKIHEPPSTVQQVHMSQNWSIYRFTHRLGHCNQYFSFLDTLW